MILAGTITVPVESLSKPFTLFSISDVHYGSAGCAEDRFKEYIRRISRTRNCGWVGIGDFIDGIGPDDKRFDSDGYRKGTTVSDLGDIVRRQLKDFGSLIRPIAGKSFGMVRGNHEHNALTRYRCRGLWTDTLGDLGIRSLGNCAMFDLLFKSPEGTARERFMVHHGSGFAATPGGKMNSAIAWLHKFPQARVILTGHTHELIDRHQSGVGANEDCTEQIEIVRSSIVCGTWLKTYVPAEWGGYGEIRGYAPTALGNAVLTITPRPWSLSVGG